MTMQNAKTRVAILGASGYTGAELVRLLARHPHVEIVALTGDRKAGETMADVFGQFAMLHLPRLSTIKEVDWSKIDAAFCALPHATTQAVVRDLPQHVRVIDISADFRLEDPALYREWYSHEHQALEQQKQAVYGLTEFNRERIAKARIIACPGCYPTAALLPLVPLLERKLIDPDEIIIDAKSGVSGAGRGLKQGSLYCEINEGLTPYNIGRHRHQPEMEQELAVAAGRAVRLTFAPHLVPLSRGMEATIYLEPPDGTGLREIGALLRESYAGEPFVKVLPDGMLPTVRDVAGTNLCRIGCTDDPQGGRLVVVSVIDNLVKGASGQALQNMNVMLGLPETAGLEAPGLFP